MYAFIKLGEAVIKNYILASAVAIAVAYNVVAEAQTTPARSGDVEANSGLAEIVVTAQRREERLQDVPIAVSAVSGRGLTNNHLTTTQSLQVAVPTLIYTNTGAYGQAYLRGIGGAAAFPNAEPSVATYVDGIFVSNNSAALQSLLGTDRVEVLEGPQGTLYGRNAVAGAINIYTLNPTQELTGDLVGTFGRFNLTEISGHISGGITSNLEVGAYGAFSRRRSYLTRSASSLPDDDHQKSAGARVKAVWRPTDNLTVTGSYEHLYDFTTDALLIRNIQDNSLAYTLGAPKVIKKYYSDTDFPQFGKSKQNNFLAKADLDLSAIQIVSITGYRRFFLSTASDPDGSPLPIFGAQSKNVSNQFSQEIQALSPKGSKITYIFGAYYFHEHTGFVPLVVYSPPFFAPLGALRSTPIVNLDSYAIFGQATAELVAGANLTLGARYTIDKKRFHAVGDALDANFNPIAGTSVTYPPSKKTWRNFSPKITLDKKFGSTLAYATFSKGYKAGVYNLAAPGTPGPVDPEKLTAYEVGFKSEGADRRVRLNAAGYYYNYTNLQVSRIDIANGGATTLQNAASARAYGAEATLSLAATRTLSLSVSGAYSHATYHNFTDAESFLLTSGGNAPIAVNATGNDLPRAPEWVISSNADWRIPLANGGVINSYVSAYYNDGFFWEPTNAFRQPSYVLINARVGYTFPGSRYTVSAFVTNLTNQYYANSLGVFPTAIGVTDAAPRMFGVTAEAKF